MSDPLIWDGLTGYTRHGHHDVEYEVEYVGGDWSALRDDVVIGRGTAADHHAAILAAKACAQADHDQRAASKGGAA
jgi:hypothetical protein